MVAMIITWVVFLIGFLLLFYLVSKVYRAVFTAAAATDILIGKANKRIDELEKEMLRLKLNFLKEKRTNKDEKDIEQLVYESYDD